MRLARLFHQARRELWQRRLPHGLIGWRYLWPGRDDRIRRHREYWWASGHGWPRPLWLAVEAWLWLRWLLWGAWAASWRGVSQAGAEVAALEGIPRWRQALRIGRLALVWCIPPRDAYRFGHYRDPTQALDFIHDHELQGFHRARNRSSGIRPGTLERLQDKVALATALASLGVPVVATARCVTRASAASVLSDCLNGLDRVFCKTRSGSRGRGAFTAWRTAEGLAGRRFEGGELADTRAVEAAWRQLLELDDALIQPCLVNHPSLAPLAESGEAITVRFITEWRNGVLACLAAVLEIPADADSATGRPGYTILPIEETSGRLLPWPQRDTLPEQARDDLRRVWARLPAAFRLPDWPALVRDSYRAHERFPDVWAIAWDWVLTPSGPVLLEGNGGFGVSVPQRLKGGFLSVRKVRIAYPTAP